MKIKSRLSLAENVFIIATYRAARVSWIFISLCRSTMRYCCIPIECYSLFIRNACTNHRGRAPLVNTDECGSRMRFRAFRATWFLRRHAIALTLIPFVLFRTFAPFSRLRKSVRRQTHKSARKTRRCLEDMITSVNYFIGDTREKYKSAREKRFHEKFTARFAEQGKRNEIIVEWDKILNAL